MDTFRDFASDSISRNIQTSLAAEQAEDVVLQIGNTMRDHIWSGGSADEIDSLLRDEGLSDSLTQLNRIGDSWHRTFGFTN